MSVGRIGCTVNKHVVGNTDMYSCISGEDQINLNLFANLGTNSCVDPKRDFPAMFEIIEHFNSLILLRSHYSMCY